MSTGMAPDIIRQNDQGTVKSSKRDLGDNKYSVLHALTYDNENHYVVEYVYDRSAMKRAGALAAMVLACAVCVATGQIPGLLGAGLFGIFTVIDTCKIKKETARAGDLSETQALTALEAYNEGHDVYKALEMVTSPETKTLMAYGEREVAALLNEPAPGTKILPHDELLIELAKIGAVTDEDKEHLHEMALAEDKERDFKSDFSLLQKWRETQQKGVVRDDGQSTSFWSNLPDGSFIENWWGNITVRGDVGANSIIMNTHGNITVNGDVHPNALVGSVHGKVIVKGNVHEGAKIGVAGGLEGSHLQINGEIHPDADVDARGYFFHMWRLRLDEQNPARVTKRQERSLTGSTGPR